VVVVAKILTGESPFARGEATSTRIGGSSTSTRPSFVKLRPLASTRDISACASDVWKSKPIVGWKRGELHPIELPVLRRCVRLGTPVASNVGVALAGRNRLVAVVALSAMIRLPSRRRELAALADSRPGDMPTEASLSRRSAEATRVAEVQRNERESQSAEADNNASTRN